MRLQNLGAAISTGLASLLVATAARAQSDLETIGIPSQDGLGFQTAATDVARDLHWLDDFLLVIGAAIVVFVMALLAWVVIRYNEKANPTPQRFTHNSVVEVVWTVVPIVILLVIAVPSLQLLDKQLTVPEPDMTIKATGHQWYWSYFYPEAEIEFDAIMVGGGFASWDDLEKDADALAEAREYGVTRETYRLATDTAVVVPVGKVVRLQTTGADVIHSWAMPSFGVKMDAVPGRLNETWFRVDMPGVYYGQCSELCGKDHAYMPITVRALPEAEYETWVTSAKEIYAAARPAPPAPTKIDVAVAD